MPVPEHIEDTEAGSDLLEFLDERRQRQAQQRRQRALAIATGALSVIAAILAVSNLILLRQIAGPQPVRVVASPPDSPPSAAPPTSTRPAARHAPAPPPSAAASAPDEPSPPALPPAPARRDSSAPAAAPPTPRSAQPRSEPEPSLPSPSFPASAPSGVVDGRPLPVETEEPDPARRTARWLVQTYGRLDAESRAARVVDFYSGQERAFWRRVLAAVRSEP